MGKSKCPVCGLWLPFEHESEGYGDYCACCDSEFGFDTSDYETVKNIRLKWLKSGAAWADLEEKPADWDLAEQLSNVIYERSVLLEALGIAWEGGLGDGE